MPSMPSRKSSTITTTSNSYEIPLYYANMDKINKQNNRIKDLAVDFSHTTKTIDTLCDIKDQIKDLMRRADAISLALTHNETLLVQLLQGTGERARVVEHLDDIHNVLRAVRTSTMAQHAQSIQNSLSRSLSRFNSLHSDAADDHIQELQESFANTDPYPPPIPYAKRSPPTQANIREISKEVDDVEEQPTKKVQEVEAMDEDEDPLPIPLITTSIRSRSPQGSATPTLAEEADHLEAFLTTSYSTPTGPMKFTPPPGFHTLRKGGERDETYWHSLMTVFMDLSPMTTQTRKNFVVEMYRGGPPHAPFFICEDRHGGYAVGPVKKKLAAYALGDEEF
jgi:uncharacterized phage infection (PIP) family protein YhgE